MTVAGTEVGNGLDVARIPTDDVSDILIDCFHVNWYMSPSVQVPWPAVY